MSMHVNEIRTRLLGVRDSFIAAQTRAMKRKGTSSNYAKRRRMDGMADAYAHAKTQVQTLIDQIGGE